MGVSGPAWVTWWGNRGDAHAVHFEPKPRFEYPNLMKEHKGLTKCGQDIPARGSFPASGMCLRCARCKLQLEIEAGLHRPVRFTLSKELVTR